MRASELAEGAPPQEEAAWRAAFDGLYQRLVGHLQVLQVRVNRGPRFPAPLQLELHAKHVSVTEAERAILLPIILTTQ